MVLVEMMGEKSAGRKYLSTVRADRGRAGKTPVKSDNDRVYLHDSCSDRG